MIGVSLSISRPSVILMNIGEKKLVKSANLAWVWCEGSLVVNVHQSPSSARHETAGNRGRHQQRREEQNSVFSPSMGMIQYL